MLDPNVAAQLPALDDGGTKTELASMTAQVMLRRAKTDKDPELLNRVLTLVEREGIDTIAQYWRRAPAETLAGVLWRLYLLQQITRRDAEAVTNWYRAGAITAQVDNAVAGTVDPPTPDSLNTLVDQVLSGFFTGDLGVALDRASAYSRVLATGVAKEADSRDHDDRAHASAMTVTASKLEQMAAELGRAARMWRADELL
jgi:hypothetical protein